MHYTFKARLEAGLLVDGYKALSGKSSKYTTWQHQQRDNLVFVGKNGALRMGPCATRSFSIGMPADIGSRYPYSKNTAAYRRIIALGDKALELRRLSAKPLTFDEVALVLQSEASAS